MNEARIKLAEAMGWEFPHGPTKHCPDPFTDANDCEALIKHLNGLGWNIEVVFGRRGKYYVTFQQFPVAGKGLNRECDDWKQGVCELALKVMT